jgi:peptidoglycan/xylan/chitin deacetylase (PgdA/CDA1 family)
MYKHVENGVFTLTLHPQVIDRGHRIVVLEKLIKHIKSCKNVWFAQMIDVARAWKN